MDPNHIRPTRGKARGRPPPLPPHFQNPSGQLIRAPQSAIQSTFPPPTQSVQYPMQPGPSIPHTSSQLPPRPTATVAQRVPRPPLGSKPVRNLLEN